MIIMMCLIVPVVLAVAALIINVVYMELARTELQITTDVATRAAGRVFAVTGDQKQAIAAAERLMAANPFANQKMTLSGSDIVFGVSTRLTETERYKFGPGKNPNAVQLKSNGEVRVPMLFPTMGVPIDFRPIKSAISTQTVLDLSLVIDRSGSMAFSTSEISGSYTPASAPLGWKFGDPVPSKARWLDAVASINTFLGLLSASPTEEHVSLSSYANTSKVDVDLTVDCTLVKTSLTGYSNRFDGGATNIGDGMLAGLNTLSDKKTARSWASRVMIVLTDGIHNTGTDPLYAAQQVASQNVVIYTITFSNEADIRKMQEVAAIGTGKHFHATTASELAQAFDEIAHSLPTLITY